MKKIEAKGPIRTVVSRYMPAVAVCAMAMIGLVACADERVIELEATVETVERSIDAMSAVNRDLKTENAELRKRLETMDAMLEHSKGIDSKGDTGQTDKVQWSKKEGEHIDRTARLAEEASGVVHYIEHAGRGDTTVLVTPEDFLDGETPLIVSLHGFGGNSADYAAYFPLHKRVNSHGFALLMPTGSRNAEGYRFWNPTDECCRGGKSGEDDVAYLTELVANASEIRDFGPIFFFGYSNGGFMAHHMACKGLPGLRAVVSLAGTSYVDDSSCDGAPPVSVLQIHGTDDRVIMFEGEPANVEHQIDGESAFYLGAEEIVTRWARRAGCDWPGVLVPYETLDLDEWVPGAEIQMFRIDEGCTDGISIELWEGVGSSHSPGYGDDFIDAVLDWLLAE